jgi:hypothetical protein
MFGAQNSEEDIMKNTDESPKVGNVYKVTRPFTKFGRSYEVGDTIKLKDQLVDRSFMQPKNPFRWFVEDKGGELALSQQGLFELLAQDLITLDSQPDRTCA